MKLQFNQAVAWRQVIEFDSHKVDRVMEVAEDMDDLALGLRMKITHNDGRLVVRWDAQTRSWVDR
jgi:hypothetical protein